MIFRTASPMAEDVSNCSFKDINVTRLYLKSSYMRELSFEMGESLCPPGNRLIHVHRSQWSGCRQQCFSLDKPLCITFLQKNEYKNNSQRGTGVPLAKLFRRWYNIFVIAEYYLRIHILLPAPAPTGAGFFWFLLVQVPFLFILIIVFCVAIAV